jgi:hypothetical protein
VPSLATIVAMRLAYEYPTDFAFGFRGVFPLGERQRMRAPAEPTYPPIHEPIDPPENPDVPVREPDPEDPNEI